MGNALFAMRHPVSDWAHCQAELATARDELAQCRQQLAWTQAELAQERRERAEHLQRVRAEMSAQIHRLYRQEVAQLQTRLAATVVAQRQELAALKTEFVAKQRAYETKLRELATELALYQDSGPARAGRDQVGGTELHTRRRSRRPRARHGGGRRLPPGLPTETVVHPLGCTVCPRCGKRLYGVAAAVAHEVEFQIRLTRRRHEREKCAACTCGWSGPPPGAAPAAPASAAPAAPASAAPAAPASAAPFIVAPLPAKAMTGSLLSDRSWVELLVLKYGYQVPLNQLIALCAEAGYRPSSGTLCDGLARFAERLLGPLDRAIIEHNLDAAWWAADDSSLRLITPERTRRHGVVWQVRSPDTSVYFFTTTGAAEHLQTYFAAAPRTSGTLLADRGLTYQTLWFLIAFCWAHVRRDFVRLGRYLPGHRTFACAWLRHIRQLYRLHHAWRQTPADTAAHTRLARHLRRLALARDTELARADLPEPRRKVLASLQRHWTGLTHCLDDPRLPLDNNAVERNFRPLARFRHNCQACHSEAGATTAVRCFTVIQTLRQNGVPVKPYLLAWCEAFARHGGQPPGDLDAWRPWQLAPHVRERLDHFRRV